MCRTPVLITPPPSPVYTPISRLLLSFSPSIPPGKFNPLTIPVRKLVFQSRPGGHGRTTPHERIVTQNRSDVPPGTEVVWKFYLWRGR